jgi:MFS family permease
VEINRLVSKANFLGFTEPTKPALQLARKLVILVPFANFIFTLSSTYYLIFIAEAVGGGDYILGLAIVGPLIVIEMAIQTLLDYPSGALGDWIGHRYVIFIGNVCFGIQFILVSFITSQTPFLFLVLVYALGGLGASQISGAWGAWFDNNYRVAMPKDTDKKQYGAFWGRFGMLAEISRTIALIPGSIWAAVYGRPWVFLIEGLAALFFAFLVLIFLTDLPEVKEMREKPSINEYLSLLRDGISYTWKNRFIRFMIFGGMLLTSTMAVWGNLILFPIYYSYLLTDTAVASYRTILFIPGVVAQERSGIWSQRFNPTKWIPRFRILQACSFVFYILFALLLFFLPPVSGSVMISILIPFTTIEFFQVPEAHLLVIVFMFTIYVLTLFFGAFAEILTQRLLIDAIPDRVRNSIYSLSPTILLLFTMPQILFFGWLIPVAGFPITLLLCACISLVGVILVRHGLSYKETIVKDAPKTS